MVKQLLEHLGITILRQEGGELVCRCPFCGGEKLYVNSVSGAWQCFRGCGEGYPYQLVQQVTGKQPREVFEVLQQYGFGDGREAAPQVRPYEKPPGKPRLSDGDIQPIPLLNQLLYCEAKGIDRKTFLRLGPMMHRRQPWILIPAYLPLNTSTPTAWIRDGLDGSKVEIKYKDEQGKWQSKLQKYPVVSGSTPALVGLKTIPYDCDTLIYAEGWKDCLAAAEQGYVSVCCSNGAGKWRSDWADAFRNKTVFVVPDRDDPGQKGADKVARAMSEVAKEVRMVQLPYEIETQNGKDLHDYFRVDGYTRDDFDSLLQAAPAFAFDAASETDATRPSEQAVVSIAERGGMVLPDDHPDTLAAAFEQWSMDVCGVRHRYHPSDGWTLCRDGKYQSVDEKTQVAKYLCDFLKIVYVPGKGKKNIPQRYAINNGKLADILKQTSFLDHVYLRPGQAAPCSLSAGLDAQHIIAFANGLLDVSKRPYTLHPLTEDFYTLNYLDYDWEGDQQSERWTNFMLQITGDDPDIVGLIQQWCGYLLMPTSKYQRFMLCYGPAGSGKGVFFDTVREIIGAANCSRVPLSKFNDKYALTSTYGKRVNMSDESEKYLENNIETILKEYTGGTTIQFERKYQDPFEAELTAKLMFSTNELPRFHDASDAIWRRLILIKFARSFTGQEDFDLRDKLKAERSAIVCFFLNGMHSLLTTGRFIQPQSVNADVEQYKRDCNPTRTWLAENFEATDDDERGVETKALRRVYRQWCDENNFQPKNEINFGKEVALQFPRSQKRRMNVGGARHYVYVNLTIKDDSDYIHEFDPTRGLY